MIMKKILMTFMLCFGVLFANAQIATQNSNALDNIGVGVTGGVSTPLDFNSVFPLNPNVGLKIMKDITPVLGLQVEGLAILNDNHFTDIKTSVKATNVGLNGVINLPNMFSGYKGSPRVFETSVVAGLGWLHEWNTSGNSLTAKTGLDFALNIGKNRANSLILTPAIYWNLHKIDAIQFTKKGAQLALNLSYIYHFKTSNGTHHFKTYDVGAMINEINYLNGELAKKPTEVYKELVRERIVTDTVYVPTQTEWFVQFAKNSPVLTDVAKSILDRIDGKVNIFATASPEGDGNYNQALSERRAAAVADYLTKKGIKVVSYQGEGSTNNSSNRIAVISRAE